MLLARLRWSAFGLRGRIVGAVLVTTAVSLGVAALVLLPRLESSLKNASKKTLDKEVKHAKTDLQTLAAIKYWLIPEVGVLPKPIPKSRRRARSRVSRTTSASARATSTTR